MHNDQLKKVYRYLLENIDNTPPKNILFKLVKSGTITNEQANIVYSAFIKKVQSLYNVVLSESSAEKEDRDVENNDIDTSEELEGDGNPVEDTDAFGEDVDEGFWSSVGDAAKKVAEKKGAKFEKPSEYGDKDSKVISRENRKRMKDLARKYDF